MAGFFFAFGFGLKAHPHGFFCPTSGVSSFDASVSFESFRCHTSTSASCTNALVIASSNKLLYTFTAAWQFGSFSAQSVSVALSVYVYRLFSNSANTDCCLVIAGALFFELVALLEDDEPLDGRRFAPGAGAVLELEPPTCHLFGALAALLSVLFLCWPSTMRS